MSGVAVTAAQKGQYTLVEQVDGKPTGRKIQISPEFVDLSATLQAFIEVIGDDCRDVPIKMEPDSEFYFNHAALVDQYLVMYKQYASASRKADDEKMVPMGKPDAWEQTFFEMVEGASMDNLIGSTNMAHYFQINAYVRAASAYLARRTDNMNVKQKREFLHEENDYSPAEWAELANNPDVREVMEKEGVLNEK